MYRKALFRLKLRLFKTAIVSKVQEKQGSEIKHKLPSYRSRKLKDPNSYVSSHAVCFLPQKISLSKTVARLWTKMEITREIIPPVAVRGLTVLDKSMFDTAVTVQCFCVPISKIGDVTKCLKTRILKMLKVTPVVELETSDPMHPTHRLVMLHPLHFQSFTSFTEAERIKLADIGLSEADLQHHVLKLTFDNWTFQEILRAVIPEEVESVTGHTLVGHIAHFNLRDEVLPYKRLIGEVLLEKQSYVKTVVNKLSNIDNTFRNFQMELLAGEDNYITQTKENGCIFEMDFSKVYWNSRLSTEHERIVKQISPGDLVFDVFAGIGPFAIPTGKKKATVYANDLNPSSHESLAKNGKLNKLRDNISCYNLDGRDFITTIIKEKLSEFYASDRCSSCNVHVVMNLPALAYTFVDAFHSLLPKETLIRASDQLPKVYCYCFTNHAVAQESWEGDMTKEVKQRFLGIMGEGCLEEGDISVRFVRNVAPSKDMMCVTFTLTPNILLAGADSTCGDQAQVAGQAGGNDLPSELEGPPAKMLKLDSRD